MGMMMSVLTFWRISGAARASRTVKASMVFSGLRARQSECTYIGDASGDGRRSRHRRAGKVGASARPLPADEIAVRGGDAALSGRDRVAVHRQAHRAAGLAPFEAGLEEDSVQPLSLGLPLDVLRARHDPGAH